MLPDRPLCLPLHCRPTTFSRWRSHSLIRWYFDSSTNERLWQLLLPRSWLIALMHFLPCDAMRCTVFAIVILSVRPSVRPSVTLVECVHMVRPTITISSPYGSPIILVSADITFIPKFEGGHPERGRWMRVGWVRIGDFRPISYRISETVRDTTKVTIDH